MRVYRSDEGVGTAIGIKQNIKAERVTLSLLKVDHTATRIKSGRKGVLVVSVYVPCNTTKKELLKDLDKIMEHAQEYDSVILGGDWNAHHRVWEGDASKENRAGSAIVKFLYENTEVRIVNSKKPTFRRAATIDFFIMSRNLLEAGATIGVGPEMTKRAEDYKFMVNGKSIDSIEGKAEVMKRYYEDLYKEVTPRNEMLPVIEEANVEADNWRSGIEFGDNNSSLTPKDSKWSITGEELECVRRRLNNKKSSGEDGLSTSLSRNSLDSSGR